MVKLTFTKPTEADLDYIAENMWHEDEAELLAAGNLSIYDALVRAVDESTTSVVAKLGDVPLVIYGLKRVSILARLGVPWMLTTTDSKKYQREYMVYTKQVVDEMMLECDSLVNFVHAENRRSLKWLKALGFEIHDPVESPQTGELFHRFTMYKDSKNV